MLEYAAVAFAPWLSDSSTSKLEKVQLEAARAITWPGPIYPSWSSPCRIPAAPYFNAFPNHFPPNIWRVGQSSTSRRSSSSPLHRMQKAPEEERPAQRSFSLSELTRPQSPGFCSNYLSCDQISIPPWNKPPHSDSHRTSWQGNVTIPAERPFTSNACLLAPSGLPDLHRWFGSWWSRWRLCRFGSPFRPFGLMVVFLSFW